MRCVKCRQLRRIFAKGMCLPCYHRWGLGFDDIDEKEPDD